MRLVFFVQAILCTVASFAVSQSITLQKAEQEALNNNLSLLAQKYDISVAEADIVTAQLLSTNPSLNINADVLSAPKWFAPDEKQYGISLAVPIEIGGKRSKRAEVAEHEKTVAEENVADAIRMILLTMRSSFYDALNAKATLQLTEQNLASLDSVVSLNRIRLQAREISESELMRSEVAAEQFRVNVELSRIDYQKAKVNLQVVMGRKSIDPDFSIDGDLTVPPTQISFALDEAKRLAQDSRPDLKALQASLAREEANQRLQEALSVGDVSVSADYLRQQGVPFYGVSLSVPIPLFNRNQGEIQKSSTRIEQIRKQTEALEQQIDADIETAWREYASRKAIADKIQTDIVRRSQNVRSTIEYAYKTGGTTILDFLDAQRTFNDAMKSYYDALTSLHKSVFALRAAIGKEF